MEKWFAMKNFDIVSFRYGSRIENGPEWVYKIVFHSPSGKTVVLNKVCFTKKAALNYIRETVKVAKVLKKNEEEK